MAPYAPAQSRTPDPPPASGGLAVETLPNVPASGGTVTENLGQAEAGIRPESTFADRLRQLSEEVPVGIPFADEPGSWVRSYGDTMLERDLEQQGRKKITAEEAIARYPGLRGANGENPFTGAVYPEIAELRFSEHERRRRDQEWIDRGPKYGALASLGVGAFSAFDPVNIAAGVLTGGAAAALGVKATAATIYAENLVGNLLADVPSYYQQKAEFQDVSLGETFMNAAAGAGLGTGLHLAVSKAAKYFRSVPEATQAKMTREAIVQHENGQKVDMSAHAANQGLRAAGMTVPDGPQSTYRFNPDLAHPSETVQYRALSPENDSPVTLGEDFGPGGAHLVDKAEVANNRIAPPEGDLTGKIEQVEIPAEAKFVNLDEPLPEKLADQALAEFRKAGLEAVVTRQQLEQMTGKQVFEQLRALPAEDGVPSAVEVMKARAQGEGFDGYRYIESLEGAASHRGVYLFDEAKASKIETLTGNREAVPHFPAEEAELRNKQANDPTLARDFSPEVAQKLEAQAARQPILAEETLETLREHEALAREELKALAKDDATLAEELAKLDREFATDKQEAGLMKDMVDCYARTIT